MLRDLRFRCLPPVVVLHCFSTSHGRRRTTFGTSGRVTVDEGGAGVAERILYVRTDKKWAWRLEADNGKIIATDGSQGYDNEADARSMADRIIGGEFKDAEKKIIRPKVG